MMIEQTLTYRGQYFVLMGRLSPLDNIGPKEIHLERLLARATDPALGGPCAEVILATNFTSEGEATAHYIGEMLKARGIKATRLARGVPVIRPDARGWRTGEVLPGGDIVLSNGVTGAALALDPGARIDVSGASGEFDEPTYRRFGGAEVRSVVRDSDGGSIRLFGAGVVGSTMVGKAGGPTAVGGSLSIVDAGGESGGDPVVLPGRSYYWRDPVTGAIKSSASYASIPDLDLFDEYGTEPLKLTAAMRLAILGLKTQVQTGMEVVVDLDAPGSGGMKNPSEVNPAISAAVVSLLNRYFYSDAAASKHIVIPDIQVAPTIRIAAGSLAAGGFDTVSLQSGTITLGNGVDLGVRGALNLMGTLTNGATGGSARLSAPRITLEARAPYTAAQWTDAAKLGGQLTLEARLLEVGRDALDGAAGTRIAGFANTLLQADEIRLGAAVPSQINTCLLYTSDAADD